MKGDFSAWRLDPRDDHQGVLYQQGRLISDTDLTEGEMIALSWRIGAARDIIGAHIAAVPADDPDGFQVTRAHVQGNAVHLTLNPGRIWADGVHLTLPPLIAALPRTAAYLPPPANPVGTAVGSIGAGIRDAVVLEVELQERSAFQTPDRLLEPALGGPDTAARIVPRLSFGLVRLAAEETCHSIGARLRDDLAGQGRLSVTLAPPVIIPGDCPVFEGGGYSGFEHNLYRVEIAETDAGPVRFKWSQFNGGLVGRGTFHGGAQPHVVVTANRAAILHAGLGSFYLEALMPDPAGQWRVVYGTVATLSADGNLALTAPATFGVMPGAGVSVFFRLWNGLRPITDFANAANPVELRDGIRLLFAPAATYRPGQWWSFEVRAGEVANPQTLVDNRLPEGPMVRRVPLAEIEWTVAGDTAQGGMIEDCRRRFRPLTNQKLCCTYVIGNGTTTFGDFNSLEAAAAHLPPEGGKLCLLPGLHFANLVLEGREGIEITGCRRRTVVMPRQATPDRPMIAARGGRGLRLSDMDLIAPFGIAVEVEDMTDVSVTGCRILGRTHAVRADGLRGLVVRDCDLWVIDHSRALTALNLRAEGALIEANRFGVWPHELLPEHEDDPADGADEPGNPADPCFEPGDAYGNLGVLITIIVGIWQGTVAIAPTQPYRALGGIHLRGGSSRVDIRRNRIDGGLGHGIAFGGRAPGEPAPAQDPETAEVLRIISLRDLVLAQLVDTDGKPLPQTELTLRTAGGQVFGTYLSDARGRIEEKVATGSYALDTSPGLRIMAVAEQDFDGRTVHIITIGAGRVRVDPDRAVLRHLLIQDNDIRGMGLSGIGFWALGATPEPLSPAASFDVDDLLDVMSSLLAPREIVAWTNIIRDLTIRQNRIEGNLRAAFTDFLRGVSQVVALGGITVAQAEGLLIEDNRVTGNAPTADVPVAGIFVGYGEEVILDGNHIAANGPVGPAYTRQRLEGLRGGIFIRMAAASMSGGMDDGQQKPALILRDNVVDQPAGRALTAFCFGPVQCVGNSFNSEREGAWLNVDALFGTVLLINLGGLHRMADFAQSQPGRFGNIQGSGTQGIDYASAVRNARIEAMLPGGETLFNANRVRSGPDNLAWVGSLVATADDLGFDGNQCTAYRPDMLFANLVAAAHSLRVTDSRFRERAEGVAYSALTITGGATATGGARSMNQTSQNQGDHCIVGMNYGSIPVVERDNQVVFDSICPMNRDGDASEEKRDYLQAAIGFVIANVLAPGAGFGKVAVGTAIDSAYAKVGGLQAERMVAESRVMAATTGPAQSPNSPEVMEARQKLDLRQQQLAVMTGQREVLAVKEEPLGSSGLILDGRVVDAKGQGIAGQKVELLDARRRPLGLTAETDPSGYYALLLNEDERRKLQEMKGISLSVASEKAPAVLLTITEGAGRLRNDIVTDQGIILGKDTFGSANVQPATPDDPDKPIAPDAPVGSADPIPLAAFEGLTDEERRAFLQMGITTVIELAALNEVQLAQIIRSRPRIQRLRALLRSIIATGKKDS